MTAFKGKLPSAMAKNEFLGAFGNIYENAQWVAATAWQRGIGAEHDKLESLAALFAATVAAAPEADKMALISGHPELGAKVPDGERGELSRAEQARAGLQSQPAAKRGRLRALNRDYREKFGFPFIVAVGGMGSDEIITSLKRRLAGGTPAKERATALAEIDKIAMLRLAGK